MTAADRAAAERIARQIFTFKLYDWLRMDLEGRPRPLNIARAFENLNFDRRGDAVTRDLFSRPQTAECGTGWKREVLPTHADHFYGIARYTIDPEAEISIATEGSPHVLMVVEGPGVDVREANSEARHFAYAETFVVPAAARTYLLANTSDQPNQVVTAFLEPRSSWPAWMQTGTDARD